jgi:hypothetical protein
MIIRELQRVVLHGDTDREWSSAWQNRQDELKGIPPAQRRPAECSVTAVYSDGMTRLELHTTDWAEAALLAATPKLTLSAE